jgi:hypothetical protein
MGRNKRHWLRRTLQADFESAYTYLGSKPSNQNVTGGGRDVGVGANRNMYSLLRPTYVQVL